MKVLIAIDSFKGSLSTMQAGNAVSEGVRTVFPTAETVVCPLADGGEGTTYALIREDESRLRHVTVRDPLGRPIRAAYGITEQGQAVMEMASAAGLTLLSEEERDPMQTTTYGVGEMIRDAIVQGCRDFIIGIGGSATNDGGVGMLQALGFSFLDENGQEVSYGAQGVGAIRRIVCAGAMPELSDCHFHVACDVQNILCGTEGCSAVYGPQKGATRDSVAQMDAFLARYAQISASVLGRDHACTPGVGAAGGLGFAFLAYLNASLEPGVELVLRETRMERLLCDADFVVTGEGRLDEQTCMGKAPVGVAALARRYGIPVIAFSGCVTDGASLCNEHGIHAFFPILRRVCSLEEAMDGQQARNNLRDTAEQVFRLIRVLANKDDV